MACSKVSFAFYLYHFDVQDAVSSKRMCNENSGTLANFSETDEADMLVAVCLTSRKPMALTRGCKNFQATS